MKYEGRMCEGKMWTEVLSMYDGVGMSNADKGYSHQVRDCPHYIVVGQGDYLVCDGASGKI